MKVDVNNHTLELVEGDITEMETDAIVNAANAQLILGGGVAGAIRRKGGPAIQHECAKIGGTYIGGAVITTGGNLKAKHVIHAVGPVYRRAGSEKAAQLLVSAYRRSLEVAAENSVRSVAFPSISTGAYGYPMEKAAPLALQTVMDYLGRQGEDGIELVRFVLYGQEAYRVYRGALSRLTEGEE